MAFTHELNCPLQAVTLQNEAGNLIAEVVGAFNPVVNGLIFPQIAAGQNMASLVGLDVAANSTAVYTFYARPIINPTTFAITYSYEVAKSDDVSNGSYTPAVPFPYYTIETRTNGVVFVKDFVPLATYLINDYVKFWPDFYQAKVWFVAGATFNPDDWTMIAIADIDSARMIVGNMMLRNANVTAFVGGTTLLNAAGITVTYFPYIAYTSQ